MDTVLSMNEIRKSFSGVEVLHGVKLDLRLGEVLGLVGENGAGKSTLMKILIGEERYDTGVIVYDGKEIAPHSPFEGLALGISMIHQELTPIPEMTVAENLFIGREPRKFGVVNSKKQIDMAKEQLENIGIDLDANSKVKELSVSEIQMMEIAKTLSRGSKVIIMDEPTSSLTDSEVEKLFNVINTLKKKDVSIIYISHKLDELYEIAGRVTVLRDGYLVNTYDVAEVKRERLISDMVGREISEAFTTVKKEIDEPILSVSDLTKQRRYNDISFEVRKGEILGFFGLVGSGRTEMVSTIFGVTKPDNGSIFLRNKPLKINHPAQAVKNKMALVSEDRKAFGLNLLGSTKDNCLGVILQKLNVAGVIKNRNCNQVTDSIISKLKIKVTSRNQIVGSLSGGNQQKVVLGKWLLSEPEIIILDEPTRGIDVGAKSEIYKLIQDLAQQGKAIILISSEMPEIIGLCDRILVLHEGRITGALDRKEFSQEKIMMYAAQ